MKGNIMLIAKEEKSALIRVRVDKLESKIARVALSGGPGAGGSWRKGEGVSMCSGYDIDGKEEATDE